MNLLLPEFSNESLVSFSFPGGHLSMVKLDTCLMHVLCSVRLSSQLAFIIYVRVVFSTSSYSCSVSFSDLAYWLLYKSTANLTTRALLLLFICKLIWRSSISSTLAQVLLLLDAHDIGSVLRHVAVLVAGLTSSPESTTISVPVNCTIQVIVTVCSLNSA